ncbi:MAG: PDZ domain-containing protein [Ruminococcaceae bacterium]|nr:PDZ domain-containing protein [Oscillospiraceae bacterium]
MTKKEKIIKELVSAVSYIAVAALAVVITLALTGTSQYGAVNIPEGVSKLDYLQALLEAYYIDIDDVDMEKLQDAAAGAMVDALGDRWSYYVSAEEFAEVKEQSANSYVGIGVTVQAREDGQGFDITQVEPGGSAHAGGIVPGDVLIGAEGTSFIDADVNEASKIIKGKAGTTVTVTVLRDGEEITFTLTRKLIQTQVAKGEMLPGNIGLVSITNFNDRCYEESKAAIDDLIRRGATALIFDVRNNPGGYKHELVKLLDYLLPAGDLFHSVDYSGQKETDTSGASCLEMPMAVLINGNSYSAAEFFAAALNEYDWATIVGDPTSGKGNFQYTFELPDGSGVGLSVGKYYTPKGVSLADQGGLQPEVLVEISDELAAEIYADLVPYEEDPQIQAAIKALTEVAK